MGWCDKYMEQKAHHQSPTRQHDTEHVYIYGRRTEQQLPQESLHLQAAERIIPSNKALAKPSQEIKQIPRPRTLLLSGSDPLDPVSSPLDRDLDRHGDSMVLSVGFSASGRCV